MSKSLTNEHAELYHYTGIKGLKGIIESQTLWATHYRYLNDSEEIFHFRNRLPDILRPNLIPHIRKLAERNPELIKTAGGLQKAEEDEPKKLAIALCNAAFVGQKGQSPLAEPYITSFCSINKEDNNWGRVADHGLLSQWRGYGAQGGYAIVFDTATLEQLLKEESENWGGYLIVGGDVVYSNATDAKFREEMGEHIDIITKSCESLLTKGDADALGDAYIPFCQCACRYKHWGFAEENEVRISAIPGSQETYDLAKREGKTFLRKAAEHFVRKGTAIPYLNLFEGITGSAGKQLPIKRIIVGPHSENDKRKTAVESLLKRHNIHAEVFVSEIPYLG
jgi:hypothetical protein